VIYPRLHESDMGLFGVVLATTIWRWQFGAELF